MTIDSGRIHLSFDYVDGGLVMKSPGVLAIPGFDFAFAIAGADRKLPAKPSSSGILILRILWQCDMPGRAILSPLYLIKPVYRPRLFVQMIGRG